MGGGGGEVDEGEGVGMRGNRFLPIADQIGPKINAMCSSRLGFVIHGSILHGEDDYSPKIKRI